MFATLYAQAQTQDSTKKKDMDRLTWEIAYNVLPLLNWNSGNKQSVFFRKNVEKYPKGQLITKYRAYRLFALLSFSDVTPDGQTKRIFNGNGTVNSIATSLYDGTTLTALIGFGYEYQKLFHKWQFFYGHDLYYSIGYDRTTDKSYQTTDMVTTKSISHIMGVKGFMGTKYFITPRWSVSAETSLNIAGIFFTSKLSSTINNVYTEAPDLSSFSLSSNLSYLGGVYVSFYF